MLLSAKGLSKSFGGIRAVNNAYLDVPQGSITGLIGPNGAGKTTLFNLLSNFIRPDKGEVFLDGQPIHQLPPYQIALKGCVRTFQVARVLSRLTVLENMLLASPGQTGENFLKVWFQGKKIGEQEQENRLKALKILDSIGLGEKAQDYAGALSGGQRKLLEIGRALMTEPKLILLDEPAAGVNPTLIGQISDHIIEWNRQGIPWNRQGITFLIIEHNMDVIMSLCHHVWVLAEGTNLADGSPSEIQKNERVLKAYLGD